MNSRLLEGQGAGVIRALALAKRVQSGLERLYRLDRVAEIEDFVHIAQDEERETLFVREGPIELELSLRLPSLDKGGLDAVCQVIEGVSHFVVLTDRATSGRKTTQLELEVQAEVDKYVVLASSVESLDANASAQIRERLYEETSYLHGEDSEPGHRYRTATRLAQRFTANLERDCIRTGRIAEMRQRLVRFFESSQHTKFELV